MPAPSMDLSRYLDLFLSEGREHVAELSAALLELERAPAPAQATGDAVARAFRAVHTIKGMAAAMGFESVADRAHALETLLDGVRRGDEHAAPSFVTHLLEESDLLAAGIEAAGRAPVVPAADPAAGATTEPSVVAPAPGLDAARHVRVRAARLDALTDLASEVDIALVRLERALRQSELAARARADGDDDVTAAFSETRRTFRELREQILTTRMVPVGQLFERFPRLVRDTARTLGKDIAFTLDGADVEIDRSVLDQVGDPVLHLLRNAVDHGIEAPEARAAVGKAAQGRLTLSAQREAGFAVIRVADDGRGIDRERVRARGIAAGLLPPDGPPLDDPALLHLLTQPGFSTAARVTEISGRGVGLDVVDAATAALGGTLELRTVEGRGTAITLRLPLSVAVVRALLARVGTETFAIPFTHIEETLALDGVADAGDATVIVRDEPVSVVRLRDRLGVTSHATRPGAAAQGVTVRARGRRVALMVDEFVGQQDVVVKRFDPPRGATIAFAGATVLADGAPALIVDVNGII